MSATTDLLTKYQHVIEDLRLITGDKGDFEFRVDGDLLYSKQEIKRHAEPGEILDLFRELIGPDVPVYGAA